MKRGTIDHPKAMDLGDRLVAPVYVVVGVLECLWHRTAQYAPEGDIGRWPDVAIARQIGWDAGDADRLIAALVGSCWLDASETHRLVVHDWPEHCDDAVHMALARGGKLFWDGSLPRLTRLAKAERSRAERLLAEAVRARKQGLKGTCAHDARTACAGMRTAPPSPAPPRQKEITPPKNGSPRRGEGPASVASVLGGGFGEFASEEELTARFERVSGDGPAWAAWFATAASRCAAAGHLALVEEVVHYAEDCADPMVRKAKDLGALTRPGAYITSRLLRGAREAGIRLPALPGKG